MANWFIAPLQEGVVSANWKDCPAKEIFPGIRKRILWQGENGAEAQIVEIDAGALQVCVVGLCFGMILQEVLKAGSSVFSTLRFILLLRSVSLCCSANY